jgi:hypothetical protein
MASADRQESSEDKTQRLEDKIDALKKEMACLNKLETKMLERPGCLSLHRRRGWLSMNARLVSVWYST